MRFGPKISHSRSALYVQAIGWIGCVLVAIAIGRMIAAPPDLRWIALALLTVASAQLTLRMPSVPVTFSVSDIFTFTAALMFGPGPGAVPRASQDRGGPTCRCREGEGHRQRMLERRVSELEVRVLRA